MCVYIYIDRYVCVYIYIYIYTHMRDQEKLLRPQVGVPHLALRRDPRSKGRPCSSAAYKFRLADLPAVGCP